MIRAAGDAPERARLGWSVPLCSSKIIPGRFHVLDRKQLRMGQLRGKILNYCYIYIYIWRIRFFMTQVMLERKIKGRATGQRQLPLHRIMRNGATTSGRRAWAVNAWTARGDLGRAAVRRDTRENFAPAVAQ